MSNNKLALKTERPSIGPWGKGSEGVQRARAHVISIVAMDLACIERYVSTIDSDTSTLYQGSRASVAKYGRSSGGDGKKGLRKFRGRERTE